MQDFADIAFPLPLSMRASIRPEFSTRIVALRSGLEYRSSLWADARLHYDVGPALADEASVRALVSFFRARHGAAQSFRFRDPLDHSSNDMVGAPGALDQPVGTGDGVTSDFALTKSYGDDDDAQSRRIIRPVASSVAIAVDGVEMMSGWQLLDEGIVRFGAAPGDGAVVTAGYLFDVEVRFAEDSLDLSGFTEGVGEMTSVPLIEVKRVTA